MTRIKSLGLAVLAWTSVMAFSASLARLTGGFARFQQYQRNDPKSPFLGLICYVGSIVETARRIVTLNDPSRSDQRLSKFFGGAQPTTERPAAGDEQLGAELMTTGTYALRTLTFSPPA